MSYEGRPGSFPIALPRGDLFSFPATVLDPDGEPIDLTTATITAGVVTATSSRPVADVDFAIGGEDDNVITLSMTEAATLAITPGLYAWALKVDGLTWLGGPFTIAREGEPRAAGYPNAVTITVGTEVTVTVESIGGVSDAGLAAIVENPDSAVSTALAAQYAPVRAVRADHPTVVRARDTPLITLEDQSANSLLWPYLVDRRLGGLEGVSLFWSTDHETVHADSGIFGAVADSPLAAFTDQGLIYRDDTGGSQTETPSIEWLAGKGRFEMHYQQTLAPGATAFQTTLGAYSTTLAPGGFARIGIKLDAPNTQVPTDHFGYSRPINLGGRWITTSLFGGDDSLRCLWNTDDEWETWKLNPNPYSGNGLMLRHIDGWDENWISKWTSGNFFTWHGELWGIAVCGLSSAAGLDNPARIITGRMRPDLRGWAEPPTDISLTDTLDWEGDFNEMGNMINWDGHMYIPYRTGGDQGAFGLLELI